MEPNFRPWPHIYQNQKRSATFYKHLEENLDADMQKLRAYKGRKDFVKYEAILLTVVGLFGQGIVTSLEFTMHNYLKQTNGKLRTDLRAESEIKSCKAMLCHNNHAERPFAVLRQYKHLYPSMSIPNLSKLSQSLVNGTHRPAGNGFDAGVALTADPRLRECIGLLCCVRRRKVWHPLSLRSRDRLATSPYPPKAQNNDFGPWPDFFFNPLLYLVFYLAF